MIKDYFIDTKKMRRYEDLIIIDQPNKREYVPISQIVYCEKFRFSTKIHLVQPVYLVANAKLSEVMKIIDDRSFVQLNNSHYLNKRYIEGYNENKQVLTTILHQEIPYTLKKDYHPSQHRQDVFTRNL